MLTNASLNFIIYESSFLFTFNRLKQSTKEAEYFQPNLSKNELHTITKISYGIVRYFSLDSNHLIYELFALNQGFQTRIESGASHETLEKISHATPEKSKNESSISNQILKNWLNVQK